MKDMWFNVVREYFPDADDGFCSYVLWEKTSFPNGSATMIRHDIARYKESNSCACCGVSISHEEELCGDCLNSN